MHLKGLVTPQVCILRNLGFYTEESVPKSSSVYTEPWLSFSFANVEREQTKQKATCLSDLFLFLKDTCACLWMSPRLER